MKHLRPTRGALKKLAQRETDPRFYKEFEPITPEFWPCSSRRCGC
jgi:hypothetical protein